MKKIVLFFPALLFAVSVIVAQTSTCTEQLTLVQRRFDDGLLEDIPSLLSGCMKEGFTKEEKANAYKLLIQTYLFSEQPEKADAEMIQFLSEFPNYTIAVNDPKEFIDLYGTYRTKPIFKIELQAGLSYCMPLLVQPFGVLGEDPQPVYTSQTGYNVELNYINTYFNKFNFSAGVSYSLLNYGYKFTASLISSTVEGNFHNMFIGMPIAIRYNYQRGRLLLFAKAGAEPVYAIKSSVDFTRTVKAGQEPYTGTEDLLYSHNKFDIRPYVSVGTKLNVGRDQLMLSVGYKFSTFVQLDPDERIRNFDQHGKYHFTEDELYFSQACITLSYIRPIYKPKKIR